MDNSGFEQDLESRKSVSSDQDVTSKLTVEQVKTEKRQIYKNLFLISFAFLLLFTAFGTTGSLQSSINEVDGLGTSSLAVTYAALVLSCMFVPSIMIEKMTVKWAMVVSVFCYSTYIASQFYPEFYTLLPTAVVVGLGAAPMWSAKCTYLTQVAHRFAKLEGSDPEAIVVRFFGIFFFFFQCKNILGNLITTAVLGRTDSNLSDEDYGADEDMMACGSEYCTGDPEPDSDEEGVEVFNGNFDVDINKIYIIMGIFLGCSIAAGVLIALFVDPLTRFGLTDEKKNKEKLSGLELLVATFKHMVRKEQLLIIPITFWSGIEQGFFDAEFTAGFVTCPYGLATLSKVLMTYGAANALTSISLSFVTKRTGRMPVFIVGALINAGALAAMLAWTPTVKTLPVVYTLAALWGVSDAIWQAQINALYGVLFANDEEAAFSNYRLWESMGFIFAFATNSAGVCVFPKIITTIVFLGLGMLGYLILELLERRKNRQ